MRNCLLNKNIQIFHIIGHKGRIMKDYGYDHSKTQNKIIILNSDLHLTCLLRPLLDHFQ